jgi:hypothetical protein
VTVPASAIAILAAVGFAISTSLQHHANSRAEAGVARPVFRQPWWIVGQLLALTSFFLHAWALRVGHLIVVQPIVVSGIVLAIPARHALSRRRPSWSELATVALTAAGLAVFLVAVHPSGMSPSGPARGEVTACVICVAAALAAARWAWRRSGVGRAAGYGVSAGILFGLTAGLVKLATATIPMHSGGAVAASALLHAWPTWLVPIVGGTGVVLNQMAHRNGPLSASMLLLNIVDVLVAVTFGLAVLGEVPAHRVLDVAGQLAGLALMVMGLRRLVATHALEPPKPRNGPLTAGSAA